MTCHETRLPVDHPIPQGFLGRYAENDRSGNGGGELSIYPSPWEVATAARDLILSKTMTWRAAVQMTQHKTNRKLYLVTVWDQTAGSEKPLCRIAYKPTVLLGQDPLPLSRLAKVSGLDRTWFERLVDDDYD
jgi:hypothetical protein